PALLDAWVDGAGPLLCLVPEGVGGEPLERWIASRAPPSGGLLARGRLTLAAVPFLGEDGHDRRLWACDVNFVRGEDSFVRGRWAGQRRGWQVYPHTQDAHRLK